MKTSVIKMIDPNATDPKQPIQSTSATKQAASPSEKEAEPTLPVLEEEVATVDHIEKKFLEAKEPLTLSKFLQLNPVVPIEMITAFETKSVMLASKKRLTKYEREWVKDYLISSPNLRHADKGSHDGGISVVNSGMSKMKMKERTLPPRPEDEESSSDDSKYSDLDNFETPPERIRRRPLPKIKLNELVMKPEVFDGVKLLEVGIPTHLLRCWTRGGRLSCH